MICPKCGTIIKDYWQTHLLRVDERTTIQTVRGRCPHCEKLLEGQRLIEYSYVMDIEEVEENENDNN